MRVPLILICAVLIAWGASLTAPFHFDDHNLLLDRAVTSSSGWWEVWKPLQTRPLSQFTFWISYATSGAQPWAWHLWNLSLHLSATMLVWLCLSRLLSAGEALMGALLFAVHPIQSEPVNYLFARSGLLSATLCLMALWLWLRDRAWPAVMVFAAALLAKEDCVTFPLFLVLLDRGSRKRIPQIGVMLGLAVAAGSRAIIATKMTAGSGAGFLAAIGPLEYFAAQGTAILRYCRLLVIPWGFTVDPEIHPNVLAWVGVAAALVLALRFWPRGGWWLLMGFVLLLPSSSIFPADDLAADRRMYLPMIAFSAAFGIALARVNWAVLAAILIALSLQRTLVWRSERALWEEAVEQSPGKARPRIQLARSVEPNRAVTLLADAARQFPDDANVASEQGRVLLSTNHPAEALGAFGRALALKPNDPGAINNRGTALAALGQLEMARTDFEKALKLDPCLPDPARNLQRLGFAVPHSDCR